MIYFGWDCWPEEHFAAADLVGAETLKFRESGSESDSYIFYRKGYEFEAEELKLLILSELKIHDNDFEAKECRIGEILGYSKEDIAQYIDNYKKHMQSYKKP